MKAIVGEGYHYSNVDMKIKDILNQKKIALGFVSLAREECNPIGLKQVLIYTTLKHATLSQKCQHNLKAIYIIVEERVIHMILKYDLVVLQSCVASCHQLSFLNGEWL